MKVKNISQEFEEREILNLYRSLDSQAKKNIREYSATVTVDRLHQ